jgi:hypothetical protein
MHRLFVTIVSTVLIINSRCSIASEMVTKQASLDVPKNKKAVRSDDEVLLFFVTTPPTSRFVKTLPVVKTRRRSSLRPPTNKHKVSSHDEIIYDSPPTIKTKKTSSLRPSETRKKLHSDDDALLP